jgi:hypothetical protein
MPRGPKGERRPADAIGNAGQEVLACNKKSREAGQASLDYRARMNLF